MKRAWPMVLLLSLSVLSIAARSPRVRPQSDHMADLVQLAAKRSPTVAGLLKMIEASDVIDVYKRQFTLWPQPGTELTIDLDGTSVRLPVVGGLPAFGRATGAVSR